jgi:outer membrane murein-binding lipoprotein Lpp
MPTLAQLQGSTSAEALVQQLTGQGAQGTSIEALQTKISQVSEQLVALRAQRDVLRSRINGARPGEVRADLQAQRLQLDGQIVQLEMDVEGAKAQLASRLGVSSSYIGPTGTVVIPPTYYPRTKPDPDMVVGLSFAFAIAVGFPLAFAYARRIWRGKVKDVPAASSEAGSRMERLEHAVDAIAIEIERVAEGQRFVTKVLADRPAPAQASPLSSPAEARDAGLGEAKPFLALGAGPMEPVRVAERQAVKQSITPH